MEEVEATKKTKIGSFLRILGVVGVIVVLFAAIIASFNQKTSNAEKVWDMAMTMGDLDAKNYFVIYSDIACPYCIAFENAIVEHEEEFQEYIKEKDILLEVRLSDFLYEYGESNPLSSRYSAVAAYCARDAGKFWDYYNHTVTTVWGEFFKGGGKSGVAKMDSKNQEYWVELGHEVGLSSEFDDCVAEGAVIPEIEARALKSAKTAGGLPFFKFNNYTSSGFALEWGWEYVLMYFEAGLKS